jgi:SAM-dependent methyltransferase
MKSEKAQQILAETKEIYDAIAPDFSDTRGKWWQPPFEFGKTIRDGLKVLDLGCGNGRFAELFRGRQIEYLGIDNSEELIRICREHFAGEPNIRFEVGDVTDSDRIPFLCHPREGGDPGEQLLDSRFHGNDNRGKFDLVLMIAVLHHIPSKRLRLQVLKSIHGVLAPGGQLIMRNWNLFNRQTAKQYWKRLLNFPYKISRGVWSVKDAFIPWKPLRNKNLRYIHSFTKGELRRLLREAGFSEIKLYYESYSSDQPVSIWRGYNLVSVAKK